MRARRGSSPGRSESCLRPRARVAVEAHVSEQRPNAHVEVVAERRLRAETERSTRGERGQHGECRVHGETIRDAARACWLAEAFDPDFLRIEPVGW